MSRDYKTPPSSSFSGRNRNTLLLGLFIGYALGLLSAIGTWMYINQAPSPYISQDRANNGAAEQSAASHTGKELQGSGSEDKPVAVADGKPRFEFYNILPGEEEPVTEQELKQVIQRPLSQDKYFLQAGSFRNEDDADNLKAKLAMLGMEAAVQAVDLSEKGIWHRVRVGPFTDINEIDRTRASLQQNDVPSSLIKIHKEAH
ncbi:MAG: SPOR domain-containing protein [Nitrosospira sp.]|nr:SPOR domain-containing protein [Nitrosospira sp.]